MKDRLGKWGLLAFPLLWAMPFAGLAIAKVIGEPFPWVYAPAFMLPKTGESHARNVVTTRIRFADGVEEEIRFAALAKPVPASVANGGILENGIFPAVDKRQSPKLERWLERSVGFVMPGFRLRRLAAEGGNRAQIGEWLWERAERRFPGHPMESISVSMQVVRISKTGAPEESSAPVRLLELKNPE